MRQALAIICGVLFIALPSVAQDKTTDDSKKTDKPAASKAQVVGTAEITKIDAKKKVLEVRQVVEANNNSTNTNDQNGPTVNRRNPGGNPGGGYPGGGYPGGGYPGGGYPGGGRRRGGYPGGGNPGGGRPGGSSNQAKQYKVYVMKDTVLKLEDQDMVFSDMHVGDRIVVSGTPKGSSNDLEATTITRKF